MLLARRWTLTFWLSVDQLVAWGILYYAYSVLSVPIARDLGLPRAVVAAAFSLSLLVSAFLARPIGALLDRRGTRPAFIAGAVIGTLAFLALARVRGHASLLLAFVLLGVAQALALYEPAFRTIVHAFPDQRARSRALVLLTSVAGFASTVFLPLTTALVLRFEWRGAVLILASLLALALIPASCMLPWPVTPPTPRRHEPHDFDNRTSLTWLSVTFALQAFAAAGVSIYLLWHLVENGRSLETAATLAGFVGAAQVPGRLLMMPLQRLLPAEHRLPLLFLVQASAVLGLTAGETGMVIGSVFTFGAASGMMTLERPAVLLEWYGSGAFGKQNGRLAASSLLVKALAPFLIELVHSVTGYAQIFVTLAALYALGAMCSLAAAVRMRKECVAQAYELPLAT